MKTKALNKKYVLAVVLALIIVIAGVVLFMTMRANDTEPPIMRIHGSFLIDVNNPYELVGDAGYVFVATVNEAHTEYLYPATMENAEGGTTVVTTPYTSYTVSVIENIKGELITEEQIQLLKRGGLAEDKKAYYIFEDDFLPEVGGTYIFIAYGQEDGALLVSGPNSNSEITLSTASRSNGNLAEAIKEAPEYKEMLDAYENQIIDNAHLASREQYISKYDVSFVD